MLVEVNGVGMGFWVYIWDLFFRLMRFRIFVVKVEILFIMDFFKYYVF